MTPRHNVIFNLLQQIAMQPNFAPDELTYHFYDPSWRLLERRVNDSYSGSWASGTIGWSDLDPSGQGSGVDPSVDQYIWGTQYIDQLVYWQRDGDGDGDFTDGANDARYYAVLDRNFSVIGLKKDSETSYIERVRYTPVWPIASVPKSRRQQRRLRKHKRLHHHPRSIRQINRPKAATSPKPT